LSVLPGTQQNRAFPLRTRFTTLWRCEIHINLKMDADAGVACVHHTTYYICQGQWRHYARRSACVYDKGNV